MRTETIAVGIAAASTIRDIIAITMIVAMVVGGVLGIYGMTSHADKHARRYVRFMRVWLSIEAAILVLGIAVLLK